MRGYLAILIAAVTACAVPSHTPTSGADHEVSIRGIVRNEHGWELSRLLILVKSEQRGSRSGITDSKGLYRIEGLYPGTYTLQISRGQKLVHESELRISGKAGREANFFVPAQFGDRPDERERPIVDRALVSSSMRK